MRQRRPLRRQEHQQARQHVHARRSNARSALKPSPPELCRRPPGSAAQGITGTGSGDAQLRVVNETMATRALSMLSLNSTPPCDRPGAGLGQGGRSASTRGRCGLDAQGAWDAPDTPCPTLFNGIYSDQDRERGKPLPFDAVRAHALYKSLFGEVEDLIKGKYLIVVPSGALTQLPFQVLVTQPPSMNPTTYGDYRGIVWLSQSHPVTVLPAVSSLKALRRNAQSSHATKAFLGIGNPLLDGPDQRYAKLRQAAVARTTCGGLAPIQVAEANNHRGVIRIAVRGGIADLAQLKRAAPLLQSADELCDVARVLGAVEDDVLLGARSVEPESVRMSAAGRLRDYRVLHFATHGALAGEANGSTEPGLLLTPPAQGSEADDGYLSASEIARIDADWVILSACNTGGWRGKGVPRHFRG